MAYVFFMENKTNMEVYCTTPLLKHGFILKGQIIACFAYVMARGVNIEVEFDILKNILAILTGGVSVNRQCVADFWP